MRTSDNGGVDYGYRRTADGKYFVDYGLKPDDKDWLWIGESDVATVFTTRKAALAAAATYGLGHRDGDGNDVLDDGYELAEVEWSDDDASVDFEDLAETSAVYVVRRKSDGKYAVDWGEGDAPCGWTDNRDLAVQSGSTDVDEMMAVARKFGFADDEGMKDGYQLVGVAWGETDGADGQTGSRQ